MKKSISKISKGAVKYNFLWKILYPFIKVASFLKYQRDLVVQDKEAVSFYKKYSKLVEPAIVKSGPFEGLRYPHFGSFGSAIFPKILGSYELELHPVIENICAKDYSEIIDIGSAEGYYAVGMAMRLKKAKVFAYDINEQANEFCKEMARLNGVEDRIIVSSRCTAEILSKFPFSKKGLIICDCEGYEKQLFQESNVEHLKKCDLLIETHDFVDINISGYLKYLFASTHAISSIYSVDDITKTNNYNYPELEGVELQDKKMILQERRPAIMEWLYLEAK